MRLTDLDADYEASEGGGEAGSAPAPDESAGAAPAASETPAAPAPAWSPSKEEWDTVVGGLGYIAQQLFAADQEDDTDDTPPDLNDPNAFAETITKRIDQKVGEVIEFVSPAVKAQGDANLLKLFSDYKKDPQIGDFDSDLAKQIAEATWKPGLDPVEVARYAAVQASSYRKQEEERVRASLAGPGNDDTPPGAAGVRAPKPFKTYDDVVEYYAGKEDV